MGRLARSADSGTVLAWPLDQSVLPANDAKLSGKVLLDAAVKAYYRISKVEYLLTDEDHHSKLIAEGIPTLFGALAQWNTTSVANGTYSLQSVVYDEFGASSRSTTITITITKFDLRSGAVGARYRR